MSPQKRDPSYAARFVKFAIKKPPKPRKNVGVHVAIGALRALGAEDVGSDPIEWERRAA